MARMMKVKAMRTAGMHCDIASVLVPPLVFGATNSQSVCCPKNRVYFSTQQRQNLCCPSQLQEAAGITTCPDENIPFSVGLTRFPNVVHTNRCMSVDELGKPIPAHCKPPFQLDTMSCRCFDPRKDPSVLVGPGMTLRNFPTVRF
jgi:hypothetical protein